MRWIHAIKRFINIGIKVVVLWYFPLEKWHLLYSTFLKYAIVFVYCRKRWVTKFVLHTFQLVKKLFSPAFVIVTVRIINFYLNPFCFSRKEFFVTYFANIWVILAFISHYRQFLIVCLLNAAYEKLKNDFDIWHYTDFIRHHSYYSIRIDFIPNISRVREVTRPLQIRNKF